MSSLVDEDPIRLIWGYVAHLKVPTWIKAETIQNCSGCKQKMNTSDKHNCRLCGLVFCYQCTGKFHIPITYNINVEKKSGTCRVCYGCKEEHFQTRLKEQAVEIARNKGLTAKEKTPMVSELANQKYKLKEIAPPEWQEEKTGPDCMKCKSKSNHNCRACGLMFCSKCTSKLDLPVCFEKKQKIGPMRCCDECRYRIVVAGWKPVEKLSEMKEAGAGSGGGSALPLGFKPCSQIGCGQRALPNGLCSQHHVSASGASSPAPVAAKPTISIYWEGATSSIPLVKIPIETTMTLREIDTQFRRLAPQKDQFSYVFKSDVIMESFYDQFTALKLGNQLYIRKKFGGSGLNADLLDKANVVQPVQKGNRNPFKRTDNEALVANVGVEKPKFHRPAAVAAIKLSVPKSTNVPTIAAEKPVIASPSSPTGSSAASAPTVIKPGQTVDDLLKSRSKLFIKQK